MLKIGPAQVAAMAARSEDQFVGRVVLFFQQNLPGAALAPANELARELTFGIGLARSYGLVTERQLVSFLLALYFIGRGFDDDPEVRPILVSSLTAEAKRQFLDALVRYCSASVAGHTGSAP
jgi:hypothetical protein